MSSSNQDVLNDIRGKIERETKLIQGFKNLRKKTNNAEVIQRCNTQIRETQSNIDYLQSTLAKISLQQGDNQQSESSDSKRNSLRPMYTRFDLIKYDCPSLGHRIQYMLQQIQFKLQVENQYREANKKISHLYLMDGDKSSSVAAEGGKLESDQRIQLLNKALKRYQDMHVDVLEVTRDMEIMNTPKYARKPLTGKLNITITCIRDLDHIASPAFTRRPESVVCIKVDDVERARTHGSRSGKWNEEFSIDVDKGHEIELCVYDKSGQTRIPVALTWALLSDITEELRKKRVDSELGKENWVSANTLSTTTLPSNENMKIAGNFPTLNNTTNNAPQGIAPGSSDNSESKIQISSWLNLEPVGQILVSMSFEKSNRTVGSHFMGGLGRHGAIKQKKEEVFEQHGHQFVQKQFYNIMCCALCGEFLRYTGFQCQDCKFLCHKKCYQKVVTKCISKTSNDTDDAAKLNHRIPHRFEPILNRGTKWCCHCGYILPWGRKNVRKCTECGVMCHAHCVHLVPDFCGMSMEMANQILTTIKSTKPQVKQQKSLPFVPGAAQLQPETTKHSATTSETKFTRSENASDDEEDVNMKLPTEVNNEYQEQAKSPFGRSPSRRAVPDVPTLQPQTKKQVVEGTKEDIGETRNQHDYTFMSNKSDELQTYNANDQQILDLIDESGIQGRNNFEGFDYENSQNTMIASNQDLTNQKTPVQQVEPSNNIEVPIVPPKPSHKSKRRRRKIGLDDFQFLAVLGKGNFGKVMLAESRHTQNLCAIKVLKKDFIVENDEADSVKSEKRVFLTANKEMHPFLLNLHCCFQTENRIYFVMEYISGGDLMWHIQKSRFSAKRAKFYACEVLLALKYFHDNGIVYRDLKLDNILLTTKGHIKIADYGLCKDNMWFKNTTGTFCGTPEFMAPEIVAGKPYDRSVDWWAFGVLLFQMLLCQSPFKGDDEDEIFNAIEHDDVKYPISMPRQTVLVLQALLTKDPSERLGSSERDAEEIMEHPYFSDIDFDDVFHCRIQPPYLPEITSEHDYSNFDQEFTSETPRLTPVETVLTSEMQEQFRGFSHIADGAAI